jgi:hypothetical protein
MSILLHGDCLEHMKGLDDDSVDFIFCDLPYGQTSCKWDTIIPWKPFWDEIMRVKKLNTPIFFTTTTKFGVELINNAPKKCPFRYDLVWVKSAPAGFLSAKKMPMRKHEMVYCFYEKLPFYDLSSHKHKFIDQSKNKNKLNDGIIYNGGKEMKVISDGKGKQYDPPLPTSVVKEDLCQYDVNKNTYGGGKEGRIKISKNKEDHQQKYDPPLPVSVVKEPDTINTLYGDDVEVPDYVNKRNKKTGMSAYEPPLPVSVVKEDVYDAKERFKNGKLYKNPRNLQKGDEPIYDPPLPTTMLEIKSTRGKHSTEKPVALMEWLLKYYSKEGDVVLDPTMGSGSTGVACKNMNRNFIGIEKDPEIYEVAVNRIEN